MYRVPVIMVSAARHRLLLAVWPLVVLVAACSGGASRLAYDAPSDSGGEGQVLSQQVAPTTIGQGTTYSIEMLSTPFGLKFSGSVPDEATRDSLIEAAHDAGYDTIIDNLDFEPTANPGNADIHVTGALQSGESNFHRAWLTGWTGGGVVNVDVQADEYPGSPIAISVVFDGSTVTLHGNTPDQAALDELVIAAIAWEGAAIVDATNLAAAPPEIDGYRLVQVTGTVDTEQAAGLTWLPSWAVRHDATYWDAGLTVRPISAVETAANSLAFGDPIQFQPGSAQLTEASVAKLQAFAAVVVSERSVDQQIPITGHTDSQGQPARNLELSEQRAGIVRDVLVDAGVDHGAINVVGKGDTEPVADNATVEGRAQNRRIDVRVA